VYWLGTAEIRKSGRTEDPVKKMNNTPVGLFYSRQVVLPTGFVFPVGSRRSGT
jgi:hypothetical protein